jgi:hypothetical protein
MVLKCRDESMFDRIGRAGFLVDVDQVLGAGSELGRLGELPDVGQRSPERVDGVPSPTVDGWR